MFNLHISFSQAWSSPEEHFSVAGEGFTNKGRGSRCWVSVFGPLLYGQSWVLQPCSMVLHLLNCQYPDIVSIPPDLAGVADIVNLGQEVGQFCRYLAWCYQGVGEIGTGRWRNKWIPKQSSGCPPMVNGVQGSDPEHPAKDGLWCMQVAEIVYGRVQGRTWGFVSGNSWLAKYRQYSTRDNKMPLIMDRTKIICIIY